MRPAAAIAIDGVLRHDVGHAPIPEGLLLYRVLAPVYNVVLLGNQSDDQYKSEVEHFCFSELLTQHSRTLFGDAMLISEEFLRSRQINRLRNSGVALDFVVEGDPQRSRQLYRLGVNVMHFMHAQYTRPQWRPDSRQEITPWDELVAEEQAIKAAKVADKRFE